MTSATPFARLAAAALLALAACGGSSPASTDVDRSRDESPGDAASPDGSRSPDEIPDGGAAPDAPSVSPDADAPSTACTTPIDVDASLTSLTSLDLASYCDWPAGLNESGECAGLVAVSTYGVDCVTGWVFDAKTGVLESYSQDCNGHVECSMAPGFAVPTWCLGTPAWKMKRNLCASAADASAEASPPGP
jgi:hypothetical protein